MTTFAIVLVVGLAAGLAGAAATGALDRDAEASGERFGQALTMFSTFCAVVAFFVQRRRIAKP